MSQTQAATQWYSIDRLAAELDIGKRTLWRYLQQGRVPRPRKFSRGIVRWAPAVARSILKDGPQPAGTFTEAQGGE